MRLDDNRNLIPIENATDGVVDRIWAESGSGSNSDLFAANRAMLVAATDGLPNSQYKSAGLDIIAGLDGQMQTYRQDQAMAWFKDPANAQWADAMQSHGSAFFQGDGSLITGGGAGLFAGGMRANPKLEVRWIFTESPWTSKGGPSGPFESHMRSNEIFVDPILRNPPQGGFGKGGALPQGRAANANGLLAEQALWPEFPGARPQVNVGGGRVVDLQLTSQRGFSWNASTTDVESKLGYRAMTGDSLVQANSDIGRLTSNTRIRTGFKVGGGALGVVGVGFSAYELNESYRADGGHIGVNVKRSSSGIAGGAVGGWAGAEAGALAGATIGSVFPGPGTAIGAVVGGVVGGLAGGYGGDRAGRYLYDRNR